MNSADHTYAADSVPLGQEDRSKYPRVLILPSGVRSPEAPGSALAESLLGEGWSATDGIAETRSRNWPVWWPYPVRKAADELRHLVRQIPAHDVIHIFCHGSRQMISDALPCLILTRFFGKKALLHFTSIEIESFLDRRRKWLMPFLRLADGIVVGSRYLQKVFARYGLRVDVVSRPLEIDALAHRTITKLQPRILVNCPLTPDFNVSIAIKAFRLVKQKYPRSELLIVGDGSERPALEGLVEQHRLNGVEFHGSQADVGSHYRECDLYLHTPLVDESPVSLALAFASGLPVVATDADGLLHMVRDGVSGMLAAVGDHVGLANAIIELIENPELTEKLSERGKLEARKYTWARLRQDWVNLYTGLAD